MYTDVLSHHVRVSGVPGGSEILNLHFCPFQEQYLSTISS